jgi:DNA-binding response OmpR family regulator
LGDIKPATPDDVTSARSSRTGRVERVKSAAGAYNVQNGLLVIEDAELHLSILRKIAEQVGFRTTGAHSVAEASELLHERAFDCITLDLSLGEDSGIEVLQLLAKIKCRAPVIVISASGEEVCDETVKIGNFLNLNICSPIPKQIHLAALRTTLTKIAQDTAKQKLATAASG